MTKTIPLLRPNRQAIEANMQRLGLVWAEIILECGVAIHVPTTPLQALYRGYRILPGQRTAPPERRHAAE